MNPGKVSPNDVFNNPEYERAIDDQPPQYWPSATEVIVRHKPTETYWAATYAMFDDSDDFCVVATWREVWPIIKTIRTFARIK